VNKGDTMLHVNDNVNLSGALELVVHRRELGTNDTIKLLSSASRPHGPVIQTKCNNQQQPLILDVSVDAVTTSVTCLRLLRR
jgi:hypothetical protein